MVCVGKILTSPCLVEVDDLYNQIPFHSLQEFQLIESLHTDTKRVHLYWSSRERNYWMKLWYLSSLGHDIISDLQCNERIYCMKRYWRSSSDAVSIIASNWCSGIGGEEEKTLRKKRFEQRIQIPLQHVSRPQTRCMRSIGSLNCSSKMCYNKERTKWLLYDSWDTDSHDRDQGGLLTLHEECRYG